MQYFSTSASGIKFHGQRKSAYSYCAGTSTVAHVSRRVVSRKHRLQVQAELGGIMDNLVTYGALSVSVCATLYSVYYTWPRNSDQAQLAGLQQSPDNFAWALMGALSCLPLFNSTAWVLGALQSNNPRPFYWAAALYALPLLRNGLDQDWFSLALLMTGIAHMQVLRVGATEPQFQAMLQQQLKPLSLAAGMAAAASKTAQTVLGSSSSGSSSSSSSSISHKDDKHQAARHAELGPGDDKTGLQGILQHGNAASSEGELRRLELEDFDRRLNLKTMAPTEASSAVGSSPHRHIKQHDSGSQ